MRLIIMAGPQLLNTCVNIARSKSEASLLDYIIIIIIIIIWTLQHSVACDDIKIVVKVAERNADRQHQNRVVKLRKI